MSDVPGQLLIPEKPDFRHIRGLELSNNRYGPGHYLACQHAEKPPDDLCVFIMSCNRCRTMIQAALNVEPPPGSTIYPGWWREREAFWKMINQPRIAVIAHKPDFAWRQLMKEMQRE